ncbi:MAG: S24/S26 family peptidase [Anaerolineales bacterium]|nr:S24/S26 family peptidase [Anaerolineales bacterium]
MVDEQTVTELVIEKLRRGGTVSYVVRTGSMAPLVRPGDHIVIAPAPPQFRPGELAFRPAAPHPVVHRVLAQQTQDAVSWLRTKGDATPHADPLQPAAGFAGVVCCITHNGRTLAPGSIPGRFLGGIVARLSSWQAWCVGSRFVRRTWRLALHGAIHLIDCTLWWFAR